MSAYIRYRADCPWWSMVVLLQNFLVAISLAIFDDGMSQTCYIAAVLLTYTFLVGFTQPYYAPFCNFCDSVTSLGKTLLVAVVPLSRGGGSSSSNSFTVAVAIVTYVIAVLFLVQAVARSLSFRFQRIVTDWEVFGSTAASKLGSFLPGTIDLTEVAILAS